MILLCVNCRTVRKLLRRAGVLAVLCLRHHVCRNRFCDLVNGGKAFTLGFLCGCALTVHDLFHEVGAAIAQFVHVLELHVVPSVVFSRRFRRVVVIYKTVVVVRYDHGAVSHKFRCAIKSAWDGHAVYEQHAVPVFDFGGLVSLHDLVNETVFLGLLRSPPRRLVHPCGQFFIAFPGLFLVLSENRRAHNRNGINELLQFLHAHEVIALGFHRMNHVAAVRRGLDDLAMTGNDRCRTCAQALYLCRHRASAAFELATNGLRSPYVAAAGTDADGQIIFRRDCGKVCGKFLWGDLVAPPACPANVAVQHQFRMASRFRRIANLPELFTCFHWNRRRPVEQQGFVFAFLQCRLPPFSLRLRLCVTSCWPHSCRPSFAPFPVQLC